MKFPIVLCDPPWSYKQRAVNTETRFGGGAASQYNVTDASDMASWRDQFLAMRPDSGVMLMWIVGPQVAEAYALMEAWGYTPIKPCFYWVKTYPGGFDVFYGPGAYTGSNVETILLGQASMSNILTPAKSGGQKGVSEVVHASHPRDDAGKIIHSRKPAIFRDLIVHLFGDLPRVEVFARDRVPGWHAIGDQLEGGEPIQSGRVITPLPPVTALESATRRRGRVEQAPLFVQEGA